jgi:hypothetical protein
VYLRYLLLLRCIHTNTIQMVEVTKDETFVNMLEQKSAVIELKGSNQEFLGLATLPLSNFLSALETETIRYKHPDNDLPDIEYNGFIIIKHPVSNTHVAKLQVSSFELIV